MNMFVAIIPLFIVGYAILVAFNPDRSFGSFVVNAFHLTGSTADTVEETFSNARSGRSTALSISVISLLITGLDVSATVQLAYARAFGVAPLAGLRKYLRGGAWLLILMTVTAIGLALRATVAERSHWVLVLAIPLYLSVQFGFYLVTPRLLLDLPFAWRNLLPGAAVSTGAAILVSAFSSFQLHRWLSGYGHAYGSFGIALSIIAYVGLIALFWVWIAAVMGTYWESKAGSAAVAAMQEMSAENARS
jgi:membrane protein